jgi:hypothetical protein
MNAALVGVLAESLVTVVRLGQDVPSDPHDIEVIEIHLTSEEWGRIWGVLRKREGGRRVHLCLARPISAIICRNMLEEHARRRSRELEK